MNSPNAEQIEIAIDQLKENPSGLGTSIPAWIRESQHKELYSADPEGYACKDFVDGYELGLQTARVVIAQSVALILAKVKPEDVL